MSHSQSVSQPQSQQNQSIKQMANQQIINAHQNEMAAKIIDGIDKLYSHFENSSRRWIWELIQNAKDVADEQIVIEIEVLENSVSFRHSGKPFNVEDLLNLILQTSMKDRSLENAQNIPFTTGKFGTGFITTHLLSKTVKVIGIFQNEERKTYQQFQLSLDRNAKDIDEMIQKYQQTSQIFEDLDSQNICPLTQYQKGALSTEFQYLLDQDGRETAEIGIQDFKLCAPLMLIFNPQIAKIDLKQNNRTITYKIVNILDDQQRGIKNIQVQIDNEMQTFIIAYEDKYTSIAVEIKEVQGRLQLKKKDKKAPNIYVDFPLVGSERFGFPTYINSHLFWPNEERSSILLSKGNHSESNKKIMEKCAQRLYKNLLDYLQEQNVQNMHFMIKSKIPDKIDQK